MKTQFSIGSIFFNMSRLLHTVRYLKWEQVFYRFYYPFKKKWYKAHPPSLHHLQNAQQFPQILFPSFCVYRQIYDPEGNTFSLLNLKHTFGAEIDWNYDANGKLWSYNLNYFNWLNDNDISVSDRLKTINDYIAQEHKVQIGQESYPSSLRIVNWIKFLSSNQIYEEPIIQSLYRQADRLYHFPEYHLMANHLLENGWAILWASCYFNDKKFYIKGADIVQNELTEQILNDGAHFERSPMYHSLILQHFLELSILIDAKNSFFDDFFYNFIKNKTFKMLGWASTMIFNNHLFPNFADATSGITPTLVELQTVAQHLIFDIKQVVLNESGYRKLEQNNIELLFNCGAIGSKYQPGHAHADLLSFCVNINNQSVIVDTGISTYERNQQRLYERSTLAHNTVCIEDTNSLDVWASFRVGHRANVCIIEETSAAIVVRHYGYKRKYGIIHERSITRDGSKIVIVDKLIGWKGQNVRLFLHFHPSVNLKLQEDCWLISGLDTMIKIDNASIYSEQYEYCEGFNKRVLANRLVAQVKAQICTTVIEQSP
jgi:hypothetical protein